MTKLSQGGLDYLCHRYNVHEDAIRQDGHAIHVTGTMPNTNEVGEFYAGDVKDIEHEAGRERNYKSSHTGTPLDPHRIGSPAPYDC